MELPRCGVRSAECGVSSTDRRVERRRRFIRVIKIAGLMYTNETPHSALRTPHESAAV